MSWMLMMMRRMMDGKNKDRQRIKIEIGLSQRRPHSISFNVHIILLQGKNNPSDPILLGLCISSNLFSIH